jgi:hypothetical protein
MVRVMVRVMVTSRVRVRVRVRVSPTSTQASLQAHGARPQAAMLAIAWAGTRGCGGFGQVLGGCWAGTRRA